jgi:hypothetical protein
MKQVISMEKRFADDPKRARRSLEEYPIRVIAGFGGQLFIIDHHHAADPNDKNAMVDEAVELAHSSEAENLSGYFAVNCQ